VSFLAGGGDRKSHGTVTRVDSVAVAVVVGAAVAQVVCSSTASRATDDIVEVESALKETSVWCFRSWWSAWHSAHSKPAVGIMGVAGTGPVD
jgi:hypothetical protein